MIISIKKNMMVLKNSLKHPTKGGDIMEAQRTRPMYKAYCKSGRESDKDEVFPNFFSFPPKVGDFVQSQSGRAFRIKSIMHTAKVTKGKYGDIQSPRAVLGVEAV